jgi:hypothetical protein
MTPRTPQCEVFWPFNLSSEFSGVPEDSKFPLLGVWASPSHLAQSGVATISPTGHIQASDAQITTIPLEGYLLVRVFTQEGHGTTFKVAKDPMTPGKKTLLYGIFEISFIIYLP